MRLLLGCWAWTLTSAFTTTPRSFVLQQRPATSSPGKKRSCVADTHCFICSVHQERQGVEIPLLDVLDNHEYEHEYVQPLPSTHLPDEMTTLNVYHVQTAVPLHKSVLDYAVANAKDWIGEGLERSFGHVAWKPANSSSLVGAIGCAAEVLMPPSSSGNNKDDDTGAVLCRGTYRFIVREIKQSAPFPIAVVDELVDEMTWSSPTEVPSVSSQSNANVDDEEDDGDNDYATLSPLELVQRTMQAMQSHVEQQMEICLHEMSPVERSIADGNMLAQRRAALEMAAVWEVFQQYLLDLCPSPTERCFTIGFMAAEMVNLSNDVRYKILRTTDGMERLRMVLRELEHAVGMTRARRVVHDITNPRKRDQKVVVDEQAAFPPWTSRIRKGMRVEYFWDDEVEWCKGTVVEDPLFVVNEYVLTIKFDDSDEIHKIPFEAKEMKRWRPERPF